MEDYKGVVVMAAFGIEVWNPGSNKFIRIDDENSSLLSYCGSFNFEHSYYGNNNTTKTISGLNLYGASEIFLLPNNPTTVAYSSVYLGPDTFSITGYSKVNDSTLNIYVNRRFTHYSYIPDQQYMSGKIFKRQNIPTNQDQYGMIMGGNKSFQAISNNSDLGYLIWSGIINITSGTNLSNLASSGSIFAWWPNAGTGIDIDSNYNCYLPQGGTIRAYVCIFSNVRDINIPEYGISIWNNQNRKVYSSTYIPFKMRKVVNIGPSAVNTGISRPMIPISRRNMSGQSRNQYYSLWWTCHYISGSNVYTGQGAIYNYNYYVGSQTLDLPEPSLAYPILSADDYFNI